MYELYIQEPVTKSDIPVQPCVAYEISTQPSVAYSPGPSSQAPRQPPDEEDEKRYVAVDLPAGFVPKYKPADEPTESDHYVPMSPVEQLAESEEGYMPMSPVQPTESDDYVPMSPVEQP